MLGEKETIAAIGTAKGVGALGIVRISGDKTQDILSQCFANRNFDPQESHKASFGLWKDPKTGSPIDEVVVVNFAQGRGFTGEDSVDVICHGGMQVTNSVLTAALEAGARLARPGEFTYRAVMSGKIDLAQAENILELIQARTPKAAALALKNMRGALSEDISEIEQETIYLLAHLEASIDFTTEDIQPVAYPDMLIRIDKVLASVERLLGTYISSQMAIHGLRAALVGKPNSGKSSLMNALLGRRRSIVTDQPGTTRDTVEADLLMDGQLVRLIDTAGLREAESEVECQGIERTIEEAQSSDLVFYLIDSSFGIQNDDMAQLKNIGAQRAILCFSKSDLPHADVRQQVQRFGLTEYKYVMTSTISEEGTRGLRETLRQSIPTSSDGEMGSVVSTQRQKESLLVAQQALTKAKHLLQESGSPEFIAFELREALTKAQEILGKNVGDDVMDRVFKEFCIGK